MSTVKGSVESVGHLNGALFASTLVHLAEWVEENPTPDPCPNTSYLERGEPEVEVVEIARRYMDTGELRLGVGVSS